MKATRRSRASWRLRSWVRKRCASMISTPASVMRRSRLAQQPRPDFVRQRRRRRQVEAQLHRGGHLVDVLAAGAAGAHEALHQFGLRNGQCRRDFECIAPMANCRHVEGYRHAGRAA
jgi:hypothetical protein